MSIPRHSSQPVQRTRRTPHSLLAAALCAALIAQSARASDSCASDAMLVFDGSASMAEYGTRGAATPRIAEARQAVARAMPMIAPFRRVGLITYGPGGPSGLVGACSGIALRFAPAPDAGQRVLDDIQILSPAGLTPLTEAVAQAAEVLNFRAKPGLIVLVTDGNETCGGSPCQLAAELSAAARDLTVHVIGFHVRASDYAHNDKAGDGATAAECLAALTGGTYAHADSVETLAAALQRTLGCEQVSRLLPQHRRAGPRRA